jgi:iduronate 2-sulfatase
VIVLMADHGWQLGEHGIWSKHTLFETSLHCPLIFSGPGVTAAQRAAGLAEYVDVYPTLCELAGLPIPSHVHGQSVGAQLRDASAQGKPAVFSRHGKGESIKTDQFRYSEWREEDGALIGRALFDHGKDPQENINVADDPHYAEVAKDLARRLRDAIAASA